MDLLNSDYNLLESILGEAFTIEQLEQMLMHQLEVSMDSIARGSNSKAIIFNLIHGWAKPQGKVHSLVMGALKENPGNDRLQLFCLFLYLNQADYSKEELLHFYHQAMPVDVPGKHLPINADTHELLTKLGKMPLQKPENTLPLFTFALLAASYPKGHEIKQNINEWMKLIASIKQISFDAIKDYPFVVVNRVCHFISVLVIPANPEQTIFKIKILSEQDSHAIVEITEKKYTELSELSSSVLDALNILADSGFDTQQTTIEFFLPFRLLSEAVDQYYLPLPINLKLGFLHRVIVRSLDRSQNPHLLQFSRKKWDRLDKCRDLPDQKCLTYVTSYTSFPPLTRLSYELLNSEFVCLGLTLIPRMLQQSIDLLTSIIAGGIPIVLWIRPFHLSENIADFEYKIVPALLEHDINHLPDYIHHERKLATVLEEHECGNHITLLWDDPYRLPRLSSLRMG